MTPDEMKWRTKVFAVKIVQYANKLPRGRTIDRLVRQLVDCGTSVGANYRAACLARSRAEFTSKLQVALEEADEAQYWLDILKESGFSSGPLHEELKKEAKELTAILMAAVKTSRRAMR